MKKNSLFSDWRFCGKTALLLITFCFMFCTPIWCAETAEKEKQREETPELYKLSNEDLLKQAQGIYSQASSGFLAQLRGVYACEKLLTAAREKTAELNVPGETPLLQPEDADTAEATKAALEHAKSRADALRSLLELIQAEKILLDKLIRQSQEAKSAAKIFINTTDELNMFLSEITWRTEDGTLMPDKVLDSLDMEKLEARRQDIIAKHDELENQTVTAREFLKSVVSHVEEIKKNLIETEARHASLEKRYSQELRQKALEKEYSEHSPERLRARLSDLQDERIWLNGTFSMSQLWFSTTRTNASEIQKQVEALSPPEVPEILKKGVIQGKEIDQVSKQVDEIAAYYSGRVEKLGQFRSALESLIKEAETFQGDATVLADQLAKLQIIAQILEGFVRQGKTDPDSIPPETRSEKITDESKRVSELISEALTSVQKSKEQLAWIDTEIKKSEDSRKEIRERLANLRKSYEAELKARQWEADIKDLTAQEIVRRFKENAEKLQAKQAIINERKGEYKKANAAVQETRKKYESLKDPLLRMAQDESSEEKNNILKTVYGFAGLEPPAAELNKLFPEPVKKDTKKKSSDKDAPKSEEQEKKAEEPAKDASASKTEDFQNLLSNRIRIVEEKQKHCSQLVNDLKSLDQKIDQYVAVLTEIGRLAMQHLSSAMEIKKRVGLGDLKADEIPDGITEALKRDLISETEEEVSENLNYQIHIRQELQRLDKDDETRKKTQTLLTEMHGMIGKRLDITHEIQKLNLDFERKREKLSEIELKSLEQEAMRRLKSEYTLGELLVGLVPSEEEKNLTELLQAFYVELMELEKKQRNLNDQKEKTERLIKFAEQEKISASKILPLLRKQRKKMERVKEEEIVKIRAQLMPEKAEEILGNFEAKTGVRLPTPAPVLEKYKASVIRKASDLLFDQHIQIVAAGKWISLFEQRLSSLGLGAEIGRYQDKMGELNSAESATERRIMHLTGHPLGDLAKLPADEKPRTEIERNHFFKGEIGILREDRYKILRQAAMLVGTKLACIFLAAIFATWLASGLINRIIRSRKSGKGEKSIATTALLPLLKTFLVFIIWIVAIISALSTLTFDVGAILAGLGIGGLAIAMASKEALSDIIGGISILLSKSFKVSDIIMFKAEKATVEEIGLRYTRLRFNSSKFLVTVPNSLLAQTEAINVTEAPAFFVNIDIPLSTSNHEDQVRLAMKTIAEILDKNPETKLKNMRFGSFDNYSFCISVRYIIQNYSLRHKMRTEIHTELVRQFQEKNIRFADIPHFTAGAQPEEFKEAFKELVAEHTDEPGKSD